MVVPARPGPDQRDGCDPRSSRVQCYRRDSDPRPRRARRRHRSGATSRNGASTKPRSHMRGCGTVRSGSSTRRVAEQRMSTSSVRGPQRSVRGPGRPSASMRCASASNTCASRFGVDRDDRVQVRVLRRAADRIGLVHARHADHDARRAAAVERVDGALQVRDPVTEVGTEREVRARPVSSPFDPDGDVVERDVAPAVASCAPRRRHLCTRGSARQTSAIRAASRSSS